MADLALIVRLNEDGLGQVNLKIVSIEDGGSARIVLNRLMTEVLGLAAGTPTLSPRLDTMFFAGDTTALIHYNDQKSPQKSYFITVNLLTGATVSTEVPVPAEYFLNADYYGFGYGGDSGKGYLVRRLYQSGVFYISVVEVEKTGAATEKLIIPQQGAAPYYYIDREGFQPDGPNRAQFHPLVLDVAGGFITLGARSTGGLPDLLVKINLADGLYSVLDISGLAGPKDFDFTGATAKGGRIRKVSGGPVYDFTGAQVMVSPALAFDMGIYETLTPIAPGAGFSFMESNNQVVGKKLYSVETGLVYAVACLDTAITSPPLGTTILRYFYLLLAGGKFLKVVETNSEERIFFYQNLADLQADTNRVASAVEIFATPSTNVDKYLSVVPAFGPTSIAGGGVGALVRFWSNYRLTDETA